MKARLVKIRCEQWWNQYKKAKCHTAFLWNENLFYSKISLEQKVQKGIFLWIPNG